MILVREIPQADTTQSGIYIGNLSKETQAEFEVLAVGRGTFNAKGETIVPEVCKGHRILANRWAGQEIENDGEKLRIMESSSAIAILSIKRSVAVDKAPEPVKAPSVTLVTVPESDPTKPIEVTAVDARDRENKLVDRSPIKISPGKRKTVSESQPLSTAA
jgi:chaperonin GroES